MTTRTKPNPQNITNRTAGGRRLATAFEIQCQSANRTTMSDLFAGLMPPGAKIDHAASFGGCVVVEVDYAALELRMLGYASVNGVDALAAKKSEEDEDGVEDEEEEEDEDEDDEEDENEVDEDDEDDEDEDDYDDEDEEEDEDDYDDADDEDDDDDEDDEDDLDADDE